jgi:hypothetical protein
MEISVPQSTEQDHASVPEDEVDITRCESPVLVPIACDATPWLILIDESVDAKKHTEPQFRDQRLKEVSRSATKKKKKSTTESILLAPSPVESAAVILPQWARPSPWFLMIVRDSPMEGILDAIKKDLGCGSQLAESIIQEAGNLLQSLPDQIRCDLPTVPALELELNCWRRIRHNLFADRQASSARPATFEPLHIQEAIRFSNPTQIFIYRMLF